MAEKSKPAKKRKTAVKRKPNKKTTKLDKNKILEYKGWKAEDRCYTVFSGETKPSLCDIVEFHPKDNIAPSASLMEVSTGKYRVAPVSTLSETAKGAKDLRPVLESLLTKAKKKKQKKSE